MCPPVVGNREDTRSSPTDLGCNHHASRLGTQTPELQKAGIHNPKDEYFVDYAVSENVDYLVTGDPDLLELEHDFRFDVVTPTQFMEIINQVKTD